MRFQTLLAGGVLAVAVSACPPPLPAQASGVIDGATRSATLDAALKALEDIYIFPEVAAGMRRDIMARVQRHEYDTVSNAKVFGERVTADLRSVSHDKHIVLAWSESAIPEPGPAPDSTTRAARREQDRREGALANFGFRRAERLRGNVGYLDLSYFALPALAGRVPAAAMDFLRNSDALIIDVRDNDGGRPEMVALLIGYLVDQPVALTGIFPRRDARTSTAMSDRVADSLRYGNKPVYLLTSSEGTISAGEAFAYDLKMLKRATLVGETSAGAANPGRFVRIGPHFQLFVPFGRAVNPITNTNWEGVGVKPDIAVRADSALKVAYLKALNRIIAAERDEERKRGLVELMAEVARKPE